VTEPLQSRRVGVARWVEDGGMRTLVVFVTPTDLGLAAPPGTGVIIDRYAIGGTS
jgi:hypothetical protein